MKTRGSYLTEQLQQKKDRGRPVTASVVVGGGPNLHVKQVRSVEEVPDKSPKKTVGDKVKVNMAVAKSKKPRSALEKSLGSKFLSVKISDEMTLVKEFP